MVLLSISESSQHVLQVVVDHQVVTVRTADHAVHLQAARRRPRMPKEKPVAAADCQRLTTGFGTPSVSGGRRPSLLFGRGVEVGLAHRAARLGTWPKTRSWRS